MNRKEHFVKKGEPYVRNSSRMSFEEEDLIRYERAFTGVLKDLALPSELKKIFLEEGIFTTRVTSLGLSLFI